MDKNRITWAIIALCGVLIVLAIATEVIDVQEKLATDRHVTEIERLADRTLDTIGDMAEIRSSAVGYLGLPAEFRIDNYKGGSCVHASTATLLHWQGMHGMAEWWTRSYAHGEYSPRLNRRLDAAGLRYAYTMDGDIEWLRKCCRLRLGCAVNWPKSHMVTLVGIDDEWVYLIDNNSTERITRRSLSQFRREWTGWAVTLVYTPPPPTPYILPR